MGSPGSCENEACALHLSHLQLRDHVVPNSQTGEQNNDVLGHVQQRKFKFGGFA